MVGMQIQTPVHEPRSKAAPPGWGTFFRMPLYRRGTPVRHAGKSETVDYVKLQRQGISIYLVGRAEPVPARELELAPTVFTTVRVPQPECLGYDAGF